MLLAARRSLADVGADATAKTAGTKSETETETETEVVDETPQKRNRSRSLMPSGASRMLLILAGQSLKRDSALWSEMPMSPSHKELRPRALNCFRVLRWPTIPSTAAELFAFATLLTVTPLPREPLDSDRLAS